MNWIRLSNLADKPLPRGTIIRFPSRHPYEDVVDLMVFDPQDAETGLGLVVNSGHKAGLILVRLPKESKGHTNSLSAQWLAKNWKKWVYPETKPESVLVAVKGRPKPRLPVNVD